MPEQAELWRRTTQRGLLIASYQRIEENTDMAVTPVAEAVRVPAHLVLPASPASPSQSTLTGAELPKAKKGRFYACGITCHTQLFATLWTVAYQACQGSSPGKNTGESWPMLAATPS